MESQNVKTSSQQSNIPIARTIYDIFPLISGTGKEWCTKGEDTVLCTSLHTHIYEVAIGVKCWLRLRQLIAMA